MKRFSSTKLVNIIMFTFLLLLMLAGLLLPNQGVVSAADDNPSPSTSFMDETKDVVFVEEKKLNKNTESEQKPQQQNVHNIYIGCPNDGKKAPDEILEAPYVSLLKCENAAEAELDFHKREANIDTLEWYYQRSINTLLDFVDPVMKAKKPFVEAMENWKKLCTQLNLLHGKGSVSMYDRRLATQHQKELVLCKLHHFLVENILNNKALMVNSGGSFVRFRNSSIKWLKEVPIASCVLSPKEVSNAATRLLENPDLQEAHSEHLDELIQESEEFRRFLCDNDPLLVKGNILELISPSTLDKLEIKYPEVLKIEKMHPKMRIYLYVAHRTGTPEALAAQLRIAFSLQLEQLFKLEAANFKENSAKANVVREKVRWLRLLMFQQDRSRPLVSKQNICMMVRLNLHIDVMGQLFDGKADLDDENNNKYMANMRNWDYEEMCREPKEQEEAMKMQRQISETNHRTFIAEHVISDEYIGDAGPLFYMMEVPGRRARLRKLKLVSTFSFINTYYLDDLTNTFELFEQINDFFFGKDAETRLAAFFGVNFIVWNRWLHSQLLELPKSWESDLVNEVWQKFQQEELLDKFDEIFDQSVEELEEGKENWARIQYQISDLLLVDPKIKLSAKKSTHMQRKEWKKLLQDSLTGIMNGTEVDWSEENFEKMVLKNAINNRAELMELLKQTASGVQSVHDEEEGQHHGESLHQQQEACEPSFKEILMQSFKEDPGAKNRLPALVGAAGVIPVATELEWKKWSLKEDFGLTAELIKEAKQKESELMKDEKKKEKGKVPLTDEELIKAFDSVGSGGTNRAARPIKQQQRAPKKKGSAASSKTKVIAAKKEGSSHLLQTTVEAISSSSSRFSPITEESKTNETTQLLPTHQTLTAHESAAAGGYNESGGRSSSSKTSVVSTIKAIDASDDHKLSTASELTPLPYIYDREKKKKSPKQGRKKKEKPAKVTTNKEASSSSLILSEPFDEQQQHQQQKMDLVPMSTEQREQVVTEALQNILNERGLEQASDTSGGYQRINAAVNMMKRIVHQWNKEAILLYTGSYLLQLHTPNADIDCLVLLPFEERSTNSNNDWHVLYRHKFFGNRHTELSKIFDDDFLCDLEKAEGERDCPETSSLYCALCLNKDVKMTLQRMRGRDKMPMIRVQFHGIHFNIFFVSLPNQILDKNLTSFDMTKRASENPVEEPEKQRDSISHHQEEASSSSPSSSSSMSKGKEEEDANISDIKELVPDLQLVDRMIAGFIAWMGVHNTDERKGMLWILSAYRANLRMRELLEEMKPFDQFKSALLALKLWAKNHFIYGSLFGLLNGQTLTTMLLHVFLLEGENANVPIQMLLTKFFKLFFHWKWPASVELEEGAFSADQKESYKKLDWNVGSEISDRKIQLRIPEDENHFLMKHARPIWPVIVPGFPTQNAAFNVNAWTRQAIHREFGKGLSQMESIQEAIRAEGSLEMNTMRHKWTQLFDGGHFQEKYQHFVTIVCAAQTLQEMRTFCDFVETRIRLQLLFAFGDSSQVQWMHASPVKVRDGEKCPSGKEVVQLLSAGLVSNNWHCTVWLVGFQVVDGKEQGIGKILEQKTLASLRRSEPAKEMSRRESFAGKIIADFDDQRQQKSAVTKKELNLIYLSKKKLAKWL